MIDTVVAGVLNYRTDVYLNLYINLGEYFNIGEI